MKSVLRVLFVALLASQGVHAQITLTSASYPSSVLGTDSLKVTDSPSAYPVLAAAANGTWDMSVVTDSVPVHFLYRVAAGAYQYADSSLYDFGGFGYQGNVNCNITSAGIKEYGITIQQKAFSLASITSFTADSFVITGQNMLYTSPRTKIAFPATYHTSWVSSYSSDLNFQLSLLSATYAPNPGVARIYTTEKDSVIGWGSMRVKEEDGTPSPYHDVLQVQTMIIHTDSFFLNGSTFSTALLTFFHLAQGQKDTTYEQNYYRPQEVTALAQIEFNDAAYTQPYMATTHVQRLKSNVGVENILDNSAVRIYPNPVVTNTISLQVPAMMTGQMTYDLIDINGRSAAKGVLNVNQSSATITLPSAIIPGIYYLKVNNGNVEVTTIPLTVQR